MKKKLNRKMVYALISFGTVGVVAGIVTPIVVMNNNKTTDIEIEDYYQLRRLVSFKGENGKGKIDFSKSINSLNFTLELNDESKEFKGKWMNGDIAVFKIKPKKGFKLSTENRKTLAVKVVELDNVFIRDMNILEPIMKQTNNLISTINTKTLGTDHETKLSYDAVKNYTLVKYTAKTPDPFIDIQIHLTDENDKIAKPYINAKIHETGTIGAFYLVGYENVKHDKLLNTTNQIHSELKSHYYDSYDIKEIIENIKSIYYTELAIRSLSGYEFWPLFDWTKLPDDKINTSDDIKEKIIKIIELEIKQKAFNEVPTSNYRPKPFIKKQNIILIPNNDGDKMTIKFDYQIISNYVKTIDIYM